MNRSVVGNDAMTQLKVEFARRFHSVPKAVRDASGHLERYASWPSHWWLYCYVNDLANTITPIDNFYFCRWFSAKGKMKFEYIAKAKHGRFPAAMRRAGEWHAPTANKPTTEAIHRMETVINLPGFQLDDAEPSGSHLHIPVFVGAEPRVYGVMGVLARREGAFDPYIQTVYELLAKFVGLALDRAPRRSDDIAYPTTLRGLTSEALKLLVYKAHSMPGGEIAARLGKTHRAIDSLWKVTRADVGLGVHSKGNTVLVRLAELGLPTTIEQIELEFALFAVEPEPPA